MKSDDNKWDPWTGGEPIDISNYMTFVASNFPDQDLELPTRVPPPPAEDSDNDDPAATETPAKVAATPKRRRRRRKGGSK